MPTSPTQTLLNSLAKTFGPVSVTWLEKSKNTVVSQISLTLVNESSGNTLIAVYNIDQAIRFIADTTAFLNSRGYTVLG